MAWQHGDHQEVGDHAEYGDQTQGATHKDVIWGKEVRDIGKEDGESQHCRDDKRRVEQRVLERSALFWSHHEDDDHEDQRARGIADGTGQITPEAVVGKKRKLHLYVGCDKLCKLDEQCQVEQAPPACVKRFAACVEQRQKAQAKKGCDVVEQELIHALFLLLGFAMRGLYELEHYCCPSAWVLWLFACRIRRVFDKLPL